MYINEFHGSAHAILDASPAAVFSVLTHVPRLPEWNAHIHHVISAPDEPLREGIEWVVQMRVGPARWPSRAHATLVDAENGRFEHRSMSDDGNPTYALWVWDVNPHPRGSELTVTWSVFPRSLWRRVLFARLRRPQLNAEVPASLAGLNAYLQTANLAEISNSAGERSLTGSPVSRSREVPITRAADSTT